MKKIILIIVLLASFMTFGQDRPIRVNVVMVDHLTTTERDSYVVPATQTWLIFNSTTNQVEINIAGGGWNAIGGSIDWASITGKPANLDENSTDDFTDSDLVDDDTFATATATNIPSAESVKAYVDAGGSFGVVARGSVPVGENTAGTIFTAIHNLGYAPNANRISMTMVDLASNSPVGLEPKITDITTTTFDFTLGSTTGAGIGLNVSWFILGNGNVSPVIEGHNIEDSGSGVTKRANLNFTGAVTVTDDVGNDRTTIDISGGGGTPDDDSVTPAKMADGDFGDFSVALNVATIDNGVITVSKMSNNTHGLFGWASNGSPVNYPIASAFESIFGGFANNDQAPLLTDRFPFREGPTPSNVRTATFQQLSDLLGGSDDQTAAEVTYDNATSGLAATNVKTAIDEVKAESIESDVSQVAGSSTVDNIVQKAYSRSEATPPAGTTLLQTDVPIIETLTGASIDLAEVPAYVDDRLIDTNAFTFTDADAWEEATIDLNQSGVPTFSGSGLTFTQLDGTTAWEDNVRIQAKFKVQANGTDVFYYFIKI